ncbi:MAG: FGGY-family carbohydrate kinase, partial [Planctomycetota bacterium]
FNPSLAGGTSQEASANVRGCFAGLDLRHTREDLVRAGMEGIAMNLRAVLDVLRGMTKLGREMLIVGGGARSRLWRQILADVFEMDIVKTSIDQDAGSLGAAALAAVGAGLWTGFDRVDAIHRKESVERPITAHSAAYGKLRPAFDYLRRAQAELGDLLRDIDLDRA